jgi:hypothetical protein
MSFANILENLLLYILDVKCSLILFVDGHHTHLTYQLSELSSELVIILISLYPNATNVTVCCNLQTTEIGFVNKSGIYNILKRY